MEKKKSLSVGILKFFALFSIISAHCYSVPSNTNVFAKISSHLLGNIGHIGVIIFFVLAGALFHYQKYSLKTFFKNKILF